LVEATAHVCYMPFPAWRGAWKDMIQESKRLRDRCAIVGVGHSRLGRLPEFSSSDLLLQAIKHALDDAGLDIKQVDGLICARREMLRNHSATLLIK
jgi:3-oxoacyl-[acyl-carrier-protein] synthase III